MVLDSAVRRTATSVMTVECPNAGWEEPGLGRKALGLQRHLWFLGPSGPHSFLSPQGSLCSHDTVWLKSHPEVRHGCPGNLMEGVAKNTI